MGPRHGSAGRHDEVQKNAKKIRSSPDGKHADEKQAALAALRCGEEFKRNTSDRHIIGDAGKGRGCIWLATSLGSKEVFMIVEHSGLEAR